MLTDSKSRLDIYLQKIVNKICNYYLLYVLNCDKILLLKSFSCKGGRCQDNLYE